MENDKVNVRSLFKKYVLPELVSNNYTLKEYKPNEIYLVYKQNNENVLWIQKTSRLNMIGIFLSTNNTNIPIFPIHFLVMSQKTDLYRSEFEYAGSYFYFDTDADLLGIFEFVLNVLKGYSEDYFEGTLSNRVMDYFVKNSEQKEENRKGLTKEETLKRSQENSKIWKETRFKSTIWPLEV